MKTIAYTMTAMIALKRHANRARLIKAKIEQYADAQARNVKALVGSEQKRLRVQDFRVLFTETADAITVHNIGPRGGIYD